MNINAALPVMTIVVVFASLFVVYFIRKMITIRKRQEIIDEREVIINETRRAGKLPTAQQVTLFNSREQEFYRLGEEFDKITFFIWW